MKENTRIKDKKIIERIIDDAEYGTLALCDTEGKPYALPINYVRIGNDLYFHGSKKGRKIESIESSKQASFSIVETLSFVPSYYSTKEDLACPATQFYRSVSIEGYIEFVDDYKEKVMALSKLMEKLQPEGKYQSMSKAVYQKAIDATRIFKLIPNGISGKFKLGQQHSKERLELIIKNLGARGTQTDLKTVALMREIISSSRTA
jgi:nitroimidazol reductase NimA-like FMN-containing flavoprotein (pyridoxamine 5'-phosphate oxidase superfamily)